MYLQFMVIAWALFAFGLILVLLARKGRQDDAEFRRKKEVGKETVQAEYKNVNTSFKERILKPIKDKIANTQKYGENASKNERQRKQREAIALKIRKAGLHLSVSNYQFIKVAVGVLLSLIGIGAAIMLANRGAVAVIPALVGVGVGIMGPDMYLNGKVRSHQAAIKSQLPDVIDLLSVCMEAGLSFDASLLKISERMEGPLIDELMTVFRQIQLGRSRDDALRALSQVTDIKELKTFCSAIIQANELGIPITNVLETQAEQLRLSKSEEIKEKSAKASSFITIPTILFILPTIMIVIMAPVVFSVMDSVGGMNG